MDCERDARGVGKSPISLHRVHEFVPDANVEGPFRPRDHLDRREPRAELAHERAGELERLRLVAALGAVRDRDADRRTHRAFVTISLISRMTSPSAKGRISSRIACNPAMRSARTASGS